MSVDSPSVPSTAQTDNRPLTPANPFDPTSDEFVTLHEQAVVAYESGIRADPDEVAAGNPWALELQAVAEDMNELAFALVCDAVERLRRPIVVTHLGNVA